jgi:hypothetical protein
MFPLRVRPAVQHGAAPEAPSANRADPRPELSCSRTQGGIRIAIQEEKLEMEGEVAELFPNGMFKVQLDLGHDLSRGRIVYRFR